MRQLLLVGVLCAFGCSNSPPGGGGGDGGDTGDGGGQNGDGGSDKDAAPMSALNVTPNPANVTVTVQNGNVVTSPITLHATDQNGNPVSASWQINRGELGTLATGTGVFTANGKNAGTATVTAMSGSLQATGTLVVTISATNLGASATSGTGPQTPDDGGAPPPGGYNGVGGVPLGGAPTSGMTTLLDGNTGTDPAFVFQYPYDGTVWPRGMLAPLLQWSVPSGFDAKAIWVHLKEKDYEFQGYYAGSNLINAPVDALAWTQATDSNSGDSLLVEIKITDGTKVLGPISQHWTIAKSRLRGTVYYNTYNSKLNPGMVNGSDGNGAVLSIQPGGFAPQLAVPALKGTCHVCHEVSVDGSTLFTAMEPLSADNGATYNLKNGNLLKNYANGTFTYSGAYPDGTMALLSSSENYHAYTGAANLFGASSGAAIASTGLTTAVTKAVTPSFSPDGRHVAFNFWTGPGANGVMAGAGATLAAMDFQCGAPMGSVTCGAPPYAFTGLRQLYKAPANHYVGWPSFSPDGKMVVFQHTVTASTDGGSVLNTRSGAQSELWVADVPDPATGATTFAPMSLCAANGWKSDCTTRYLPTNANNHMDDQQLNFEPNMTPISSGGYYWVIFTSRRLYGNVATTDPYFPVQGGAAATTPPTKKLWVAAIDPNPAAGKDPSHPAFYLPGQEIMSGNMRAYWVNDPCHSNGIGCLTGDECCSGYCVDNGSGALVCGDKPAGCVPEFGKCTTDADCCNGEPLVCTNNICTQPPIM